MADFRVQRGTAYIGSNTDARVENIPTPLGSTDRAILRITSTEVVFNKDDSTSHSC